MAEEGFELPTSRSGVGTLYHRATALPNAQSGFQPRIMALDQEILENGTSDIDCQYLHVWYGLARSTE